MDAATRRDEASVAVLQSEAPEWLRAECLEAPERHWERFYRTRADSFFKDRHVLRAAFPELMPPDLDPSFQPPALLPPGVLPALYQAAVKQGAVRWRPADFWDSFDPGGASGPGGRGRVGEGGGQTLRQASREACARDASSSWVWGSEFRVQGQGFGGLRARKRGWELGVGDEGLEFRGQG